MREGLREGKGEKRREGRGVNELVLWQIVDGFNPVSCCPCCRDETLLIHSAYEQVLSAAAQKGERKKVAEVQETAAQAIQQA